MMNCRLYERLHEDKQAAGAYTAYVNETSQVFLYYFYVTFRAKAFIFNYT